MGFRQLGHIVFFCGTFFKADPQFGQTAAGISALSSDLLVVLRGALQFLQNLAFGELVAQQAGQTSLEAIAGVCCIFPPQSRQYFAVSVT